MIIIYTILVDSTNELKTTVRERIMQRNKNVDILHFLVVPTYKDMDMGDFTVTLEYIRPVTKEYVTENLVKSDDLYKECYEYKLPIDTTFTKEPGNVELQLTFTKVSMEDDGTVKQYTRHTSSTVMKIIPISAWSDMIPDPALTSLDQRLLKADAMIQQLTDLADYLDDNKADDITLDNGILQLLANKKLIGNPVDLKTGVNHPGGNPKVEVVEF